MGIVKIPPNSHRRYTFGSYRPFYYSNCVSSGHSVCARVFACCIHE